MSGYGVLLCGVILSTVTAFAIENKAGTVEGTVKKIDAAAKTVVVKTADGAERVFHFADRTAVHSGKAVAKGTKETVGGLEEGTEVVVHFTTKGARDTADEIDHVGKDGLKMTEGTVQSINRHAKTLTVKAADGTEQTFGMADRAARDAGKDIGEGAEKSGKATVYYTEEAGHKVVHFVKKVL